MTRIPGEWRYFDGKLGIPYPWYTKTALEFLETLDLSGKAIFEYGVGESTFWWKRKTPFVCGVDNDIEWALKVRSFGRPFFLEYVSCIESSPYKPYDIVIIDGVWRDECTEYALKALKPGGLLIIDNYKQPSVQAEWPLTEKLIEGKPITVYKEPEHDDWQTAIIINS